MENEKCSVIISSCDSFSDLWDPFFTLFFRYWKDCPYELYLISNELDYNNPLVHVIKTGTDKGWASNLLYALEVVDSNYIIYFQEDYLFQSAVDTSTLKSFVDLICSEKAACLRIRPTPGANKKLPDREDVGLITYDQQYRVSLQAAIWNVDCLRRLMVEGETGWNMEHRGTARSQTMDECFLSVFEQTFKGVDSLVPIDYYCTAVVKGYWVYGAIRLCMKEGIDVDLSRRNMQKGRKIKLKYYFFKILSKIGIKL